MFVRLTRALPVVRATRLPSTLARVAPTVVARPLTAVQPLASAVRTLATAARKRSTSRGAKRTASKGRRASSRPRAASRRRSSQTAAEKKAAARRERVAEMRRRRQQKKEEKAEARRQRMAEFRQRRAAKKEQLKQHKREVRERARERHWMSVARKEEKVQFRKLRQKAVKAGDPAAPKRAKNAYMFFANVRFTELVKAGEKTNVKAIAKQIGEEWKAMTADQKKPYEEKSAADKARAAEERAAYNAQLPKRPLSGYLRFANEQRSKLIAADAALAKDVAALSKKTGALWKELPEAEKKVFNDAAAAEQGAFEAAKAKFIDAQLEKLPSDLRAIMKQKLPGNLNEVRPWVAKVQSLLEQEMAAEAADAAVAQAVAEEEPAKEAPKKAKKKASA